MTAAPSSPLTPAAIGRHVAGHVLGAGMLIAPPVTVAVAGEADLVAWAVSLASGAGVCAVLAVLTRRVHGPREAQGPRTFPDTLGDLLGSAAGTAVRIALIPAFAAGQAAIIWFIVWFAGAANPAGVVAPFDRPHVLCACALTLVAIVSAASRVPVTLRFLRFRTLSTMALAAVAALVVAPPGDAAAGGGVWPAMAALLFAGYGWEDVVSVSARPGISRLTLLAGVAAGAAVVGAVYLTLAVLLRSGGLDVVLPLHARWALSAAVACVLLTYCVTNLRAVGALAQSLLPKGAPGAAGLLGVGLLLVFFLLIGRGEVARLLMVPAVVIAGAYGLGAVAAIRHGGVVMRSLAGALLLYLALLVTAAAWFLVR